MLNIFLGVAVTGIGTYIGYKQSAKYRKREEFFRDFITFNQLLTAEINYSKNTLPEILKKNSFSGIFSGVLSEFLMGLGKETSLSDQNGILKDADMQLLYNYFSVIGKSDVKTQLDYLNSAKEWIKKQYDEAIDERKKYSKLSIKLGFLTGLAVFIIII